MGGWVESNLLVCGFLSRQLLMGEVASEERKPRISASEGTCKILAAWNPFNVSAQRLPSL